MKKKTGVLMWTKSPNSGQVTAKDPLISLRKTQNLLYMVIVFMMGKDYLTYSIIVLLASMEDGLIRVWPICFPMELVKLPFSYL